MANNPYVNKVEKADGTTLMDITDTTAEANDVETGRVFYAASGARTVGTGAGGSSKLDQVATYALYSESETYAVDDIVTINSRVWQCTVPIETPEEWTESHWAETTIGSIIEESAVTYNDFTGATASAAGVHGLVPAPAAGAENKILAGDGSWKYLTTASYTFALDTVTNTSGAYSHATTIQGVTADMKAYMLELGDPSVFNDQITITCADGSITLACNEVAGTSTVKVTVQKQVDGSSQTITSAEFDVLAGRIGTLSSLTTTDKSSLVAAINEVNAAVPDVVDSLNSTSDVDALSAAQGRALNIKKAFDRLSYIENGNLLTTIQSAITNGSNSGIISVFSSTNTPDSSKAYKVQYVKDGSSASVSLVAVENASNAMYLAHFNNNSASSITWEQLALNSKITFDFVSSGSILTYAESLVSAGGSDMFYATSGTTDRPTGTGGGYVREYRYIESQYTYLKVVFYESATNKVFVNTKWSNGWLGWEELALNSKIANENISGTTVSDIQTNLVSFSGTLSNDETRGIKFYVATSSGEFIANYYYGKLTRYSSTRFIVNVQSIASGADLEIIGSYNNGTWAWNSLALNSKVTEFTVVPFSGTTDSDGDITPDNTKSANNGWRIAFATNSQSSAFGFIPFVSGATNALIAVNAKGVYQANKSVSGKAYYIKE